MATWKHFGVFATCKDCDVPKKIAQTRWVLTRRMADGQKNVKARLVAKEFQNPVLRENAVDASGCFFGPLIFK